MRSGTLHRQVPAGSPGASVALACCHLVCRQVDRAVEQAGKALDEGYTMTTNMFIHPFERLLSQSPGWPALMLKLNLPE